MTPLDYANYVARTYPVHWIDGLPWRIKNRILEPVAPPHQIERVSQSKIRDVLNNSSALLARWNEGWDTAPCDWWWICCDNHHYDLDRLPRHGRRDARQGLARCEVRTIDTACLSELGYAVYKAAYARYPNHVRPAPESKFVDEIHEAGESGCYEYWGCFVEGELAAFARCILLGDVVILSEVKSDPAHLATRPNNALIYTLTRNYMRSGEFRYITDGSRMVHHQTQFQDFLEKSGYRRIYCPLRVAMAPWLAAAVRSRFIEIGRLPGLARIMPGLSQKIEAVTALWSIAQSCRPIPSPTP